MRANKRSANGRERQTRCLAFTHSFLSFLLRLVASCQTPIFLFHPCGMMSPSRSSLLDTAQRIGVECQPPLDPCSNKSSLGRRNDQTARPDNGQNEKDARSAPDVSVLYTWHIRCGGLSRAPIDARPAPLLFIKLISLDRTCGRIRLQGHFSGLSRFEPKAGHQS